MEPRRFAVRKSKRSGIWQKNGAGNISVIRNVWVSPVALEIDNQSWANRESASGIGYEVCDRKALASGESHGSSLSETVPVEFVLLSSVD
jgi:hypothetical protein